MKKLTLTVTSQIDDQGTIFLTTPDGDTFILTDISFSKKAKWKLSKLFGQKVDPNLIGSIIMPSNPIGILKEFLDG